MKTLAFMGKHIVVDEAVEADFLQGEGPIAAKYLNLQEGDVFFDVGSSWAMWTLYGLASGALVYSFEPSVPHYKRLLQYIEANEGFMKKCRPLNVALDQAENVKTLGDWYGAHGWSGELTEDCFVPTMFRTIDSFLPELKRLDCLKIDVEGGEYDVLLGGLKALRQFKPKLIIENHLGVDQIGDWMRRNSIYEGMVGLLRELGYTITEEPHQGRGFIIGS